MIHHRRSGALATLGLAATLLGPAAAAAGLPVIDGVRSVASINGAPLSLDEYLDALGAMHAGAEDAPRAVPQRDPMALLERLVQAELILQEARTIGLDALPEYQKPLERFREETLRAMLFERALGAPAPADPAAVGTLLREQTEECEVALALFAERAEAEAFAAQLLAEGADFGELAARLVADGRAKEYQAPRFVPRARLHATVAEALALLEPGQTSPPIELASGIGVLRLSAARVPDDPAARESAESEIAARQRSTAIRAYVDGLRAKRAKTDDALLASLDFDAAAQEFDKFLADERVLVRIEGGDPIRVQDLARLLKSRMYHGVEQAAQKGRLGRSKGTALEQLTSGRVLDAEARRKKLDSTDEFRARITEFEDATLFGLFMARVIEPSIEVTDAEILAYREAHAAEFMDPEMVRLESLTFAEPSAAQQALERLNAGADLRWTRENAAGQVAPNDVPEELRFDNRLLMLSILPAGVQEALTGAPSGSYRLYGEAPGRNHVLFVRDRVAPRPRADAQVRDEVRARVFADEREVALAEFSRKLRQASEVRLFVDSEALRTLAAGEH